jgi:single-stranded DNA-binding protein
MSLDVLIHGKLRGAVQVKTASNGRAYAVFKLSTTDKKNEGVLVSCIAFSATAVDMVERLADGDSVAVSGEAAISTWQGKDGTTRTGLDVTVHAAMTAYHAGRKRADKPKPQGTPAQGGDRRGECPDGFDDFGPAGDL